ncbi:unnamed protein product [Amoebophrya sp. A120]|nr:unnamed protein product [Amoebophrya sp. A120]|eukprot:GSA120T00020769001.1
MGQKQSKGKGMRRLPPAETSTCDNAKGLPPHTAIEAGCLDCNRCFRPEAKFGIDARECLRLHILQRHEHDDVWCVRSEMDVQLAQDDLYRLCRAKYWEDESTSMMGNDYLRLIQVLDIDPVVFESERNQREHYEQILSEQAAYLQPLSPSRPRGEDVDARTYRRLMAADLQPLSPSTSSPRGEDVDARTYRHLIDLNAKDGPERFTPLIAAVFSERRDVVKILLNTISSEPVHTLVPYAASCGLPRAAATVKSLTSGTVCRWSDSGNLINPRPRDKEIQFHETNAVGETALSAAVITRDAEASAGIVEDLLSCYEANLESHTVESREKEVIHAEQVANMFLLGQPEVTARQLGRTAIADCIGRCARRRQKDMMDIRLADALRDQARGLTEFPTFADRCVDLCARMGVQVNVPPAGCGSVEKASAELEPECMVCYEKIPPPFLAVQPCGHGPLCHMCTQQVFSTTRPACPMCRCDALKLFRVYLASRK